MTPDWLFDQVPWATAVAILGQEYPIQAYPAVPPGELLARTFWLVSLEKLNLRRNRYAYGLLASLMQSFWPFGISLCTAQSGFTLQNVWRNMQEIAQHSLGSVTVVFVLLALLLMICAPMARGRIRTAAWLFSIALLLVLTSSILAAMELPAGATTVYWAALICGSVAIVNLASLVVFDVALTLARTPRCLRDLVVACAYIGVNCAACQRRQFPGSSHDLGDLDRSDWFLTARHPWQHYGWAGVADGKSHQRR